MLKKLVVGIGFRGYRRCLERMSGSERDYDGGDPEANNIAPR
jgi:hypothetical protein